MPMSMEEFDLMLYGEPDLAFEVIVPPEMQEAMTSGGVVAPRIGRRQALQVPAVLRSRNLIAGTLARLPIHIRDKERRKATPTTLLEQINPDVPNVVTFAETYEDLLFEGIAWWRVLDRGFHGYPTFAEHVSTSRVYVSGGPLLPLTSNDTLSPGPARVYIDGLPVQDRDVVRFDSPNPALLVHAARAIRTCLLLDDTAADYAKDRMPLGYMTPRDNVPPPREDEGAIEKRMNTFEDARRQRVWAYIGSKFRLDTLQFNAEEIQLADARQHAVLEIARACGIDPEDLGVSTTSRTYQNSEQRRQDLIDFTLMPYSSALEQRLSMGDVTPRGYEVKVNFDGFLRADTKTRYEAHDIALKAGFRDIPEVRELEDLPAKRMSRPVPQIDPQQNGNADALAHRT